MILHLGKLVPGGLVIGIFMKKERERRLTG